MKPVIARYLILLGSMMVGFLVAPAAAAEAETLRSLIVSGPGAYLDVEYVLAAQFIGAFVTVIALCGWGFATRAFPTPRDAAWSHVFLGLLIASLVPFYFLIRVRFQLHLDTRLLPILGLGFLATLVAYFVPRGRGPLQKSEITAGLVTIVYMAWFVFLTVFLRNYVASGVAGASALAAVLAGCLIRIKTRVTSPPAPSA